MIRFLAILLLVFFIYRIVRSLFRTFSGSDQRANSSGYNRTSEPKKTKIKNEDIIDAEFEEIKEKDNEKESSKS